MRFIGFLAAAAALQLNDTLLIHTNSTQSANCTTYITTGTPTAKPTVTPTVTPTARPTAKPTAKPTVTPTVKPLGGIKGVNLGGWLLLERWITVRSDLWSGVPADIESEYNLMQNLAGNGYAKMKAHRDTFITEADFSQMAQWGLNAVRIPIGYWVRADSSNTFAPGAVYYLDNAMTWANNHGLKVLVDIHGAKGSQSGDWTSAAPNVGVMAWDVPDTLLLVKFIANRYKYNSGFLGIGLLNEPNNVDLGVLQKYYLDAYTMVRETVGSNCLLTVAPQVTGQYPSAPGNWQSFMTNAGYHGVVMEWHKYQLWYGFTSKQDLMNLIQGTLTNDISSWAGIPLLIGEWTATQGSQVPLPSDQDWKDTINAQVKAYSQTIGTIFWTWKFYGDKPEWSNPWSFQNAKYRNLL